MMRDDNNIGRGGLSQKMSAFTPEPPEFVWEGISERIEKKKSRRGLIIFLGAAAGLALAITVGVALLFHGPEVEYAGNPQDMQEIGSVPGNQDNGGDVPQRDNEETEFTPGEYIEKGTNAGQEQQTSTIRKASESRLEKKVQQEMERMIRESDNQTLAATEVLVEPDIPEVIRTIDEVNRESVLTENVFEESAVDTLSNQSDQGPVTDVVNEDSLLKLLNPVFIADEEGLEQEDSDSKWSLGATLAPLYSYRDVASSDLYLNQLANASESGRVSYGAGVNVSYKANDKLTIESGLHYSQMGLNIGEYSSFTSSWRRSENLVYANSASVNVVSVSNSIGTIKSSGTDLVTNSYGGDKSATDYHLLNPGELKVADVGVQSFSQILEYVEIPLNVKYKLLDKKFKMLVIGGVSTNVLFNASVMAKTGMGDVIYGGVDDIRTVNYSGNAGLGFVYDFPGNFSVCLEPRFKYYLNSINDNNLPSTRPYAFGVYTGINYLF